MSQDHPEGRPPRRAETRQGTSSITGSGRANPQSSQGTISLTNNKAFSKVPRPVWQPPSRQQAEAVRAFKKDIPHPNLAKFEQSISGQSSSFGKPSTSVTAGQPSSVARPSTSFAGPSTNPAQAEAEISQGTPAADDDRVTKAENYFHSLIERYQPKPETDQPPRKSFQLTEPSPASSPPRSPQLRDPLTHQASVSPSSAASASSSSVRNPTDFASFQEWTESPEYQEVTERDRTESFLRRQQAERAGISSAGTSRTGSTDTSPTAGRTVTSYSRPTAPTSAPAPESSSASSEDSGTSQQTAFSPEQSSLQRLQRYLATTAASASPTADPTRVNLPLSSSWTSISPALNPAAASAARIALPSSLPGSSPPDSDPSSPSKHSKDSNSSHHSRQSSWVTVTPAVTPARTTPAMATKVDLKEVGKFNGRVHQDWEEKREDARRWLDDFDIAHEDADATPPTWIRNFDRSQATDAATWADENLADLLQTNRAAATEDTCDEVRARWLAKWAKDASKVDNKQILDDITNLKQRDETLKDYFTRTMALLRKARSPNGEIPLVTTLAVNYFLQGLTNREVRFEAMLEVTSRTTIEEAHELAQKSQKKVDHAAWLREQQRKEDEFAEMKQYIADISSGKLVNISSAKAARMAELAGNREPESHVGSATASMTPPRNSGQRTPTYGTWNSQATPVAPPRASQLQIEAPQQQQQIQYERRPSADNGRPPFDNNRRQSYDNGNSRRGSFDNNRRPSFDNTRQDTSRGSIPAYYEEALAMTRRAFAGHDDIDPMKSSCRVINGSDPYQHMKGNQPLCTICGNRGHMPAACKSQPLLDWEQKLLQNFMSLERAQAGH